MDRASQVLAQGVHPDVLKTKTSIFVDLI